MFLNEDRPGAFSKVEGRLFKSKQPSHGKEAPGHWPILFRKRSPWAEGPRGVGLSFLWLYSKELHADLCPLGAHYGQAFRKAEKASDWRSLLPPPAQGDGVWDKDNASSKKGPPKRKYPVPGFGLRRVTGPTGRSSYEQEVVRVLLVGCSCATGCTRC